MAPSAATIKVIDNTKAKVAQPVKSSGQPKREGRSLRRRRRRWFVRSKGYQPIAMIKPRKIDI